MTTEELIQQLQEAASTLSYYNAAEGDSRVKEREARGVAYAEFARLRELCKLEGIDTEPLLRGYLV